MNNAVTKLIKNFVIGKPTGSINNTVSNNNQDDIDKLADIVTSRVLYRISNCLTEEDMQYIEQIDEQDTTGKKVEEFLHSKIPNLEILVTEEVSWVTK